MLNRQLEVHESLFSRVILLLNIEKNILGETRSLNFKLCLQRTLPTTITVIITIISTHDSITVITITTATMVEGTITMGIQLVFNRYYKCQRVSTAAMNHHDQKASWEGKIYLANTSTLLFISERNQDRNSNSSWKQELM